jgi:3-hydroxyisobutyrate dehydrogenase-like beta-hydroxyacid dehydrogenase
LSAASAGKTIINMSTVETSRYLNTILQPTQVHFIDVSGSVKPAQDGRWLFLSVLQMKILK